MVHGGPLLTLWTAPTENLNIKYLPSFIGDCRSYPVLCCEVTERPIQHHYLVQNVLWSGTHCMVEVDCSLAERLLRFAARQPPQVLVVS